jgi:hypothetical protein
MLIIDEPIFGDKAFCETMLSIAKFSMPQVSGIHMVSILYFESNVEQSRISLTERSEPKL